MASPRWEQLQSPASRAQLRQLFLSREYVSQRALFVEHILRKLKFRDAPRCADRLVQRTTELVELGWMDDQIYRELHRLVHEDLFPSDEYQAALARCRPDHTAAHDDSCKAGSSGTWSRARNRTEQIAPLLRNFLATPGWEAEPHSNKGQGIQPRDRGAGSGRPVHSYLDVGCNEGSITAALGSLLHAEHICGCDIALPPQRDGQDAEPPFAFSLLDLQEPNRLPYDNASQDVVSAFMSLHHIERLDLTLAEIHRVLRDDGIFLIREHDCRPPALSLLLDLMHGFYAMVWPNQPEMADFAKFFSCYREREQLRRLIEQPLSSSRPGGPPQPLFKSVLCTEARGAWRYYYEIFVKYEAAVHCPAQVHAWFPGAELDTDPTWRSGSIDADLRTTLSAPKRSLQASTPYEARSSSRSYRRMTESPDRSGRNRYNWPERPNEPPSGRVPASATAWHAQRRAEDDQRGDGWRHQRETRQQRWDSDDYPTDYRHNGPFVPDRPGPSSRSAHDGPRQGGYRYNRDVDWPRQSPPQSSPRAPASLDTRHGQRAYERADTRPFGFSRPERPDWDRLDGSDRERWRSDDRHVRRDSPDRHRTRR